MPRCPGRRTALKAAAAVLAVGLAIYGALRPVSAPGRSADDGKRGRSSLPRRDRRRGYGRAWPRLWQTTSRDSLATVPGLTIVPRSAPLKPADRLAQLDKVAAESGATAIVDGTLERLSDRMRISLGIRQPGNARCERWHRTFPGSDVASLGQTVAAALDRRLQLAAASRRGRAVDSRPMTATLLPNTPQARDFLRRPDDKENLDRSIALFRSAIAKDTRFRTRLRWSRRSLVEEVSVKSARRALGDGRPRGDERSPETGPRRRDDSPFIGRRLQGQEPAGRCARRVGKGPHGHSPLRRSTSSVRLGLVLERASGSRPRRDAEGGPAPAGILGASPDPRHGVSNSWPV